MHRWFLLGGLVVLLAGCAASPEAPDSKRNSDALLAAQIAHGRAALAPGQPPRVLFAGFAMHSDSKAFRGDVRLAEAVMLSVDPQAVVFKLANPAFGEDADWPFATRENMETVLKSIAAQVRAGDKVVLLIASHGGPRVLGVKAANRDLGLVSAADLQQWLQPLAGKPTLLVLSACHSGSFIPALRDPSRIILAAAAADRNSFGCQYHSNNTFFVDELLRQEEIGRRSVMRLMQQARTGVERREASMKATASRPQSFVGDQARAWAAQPLAEWLRAGTP